MLKLQNTRYEVDKPKPKRTRRNLLITTIPAIMIAAGIYLSLLVTAPSKQSPFAIIHKPAKPATVITGQHLYIPKIGVNIEYAAGTQALLNHQSWWRYPERGDPIKGGNFILSAHRFNLGLLPGETRLKSPFYNLNKLEAGDHVFIDFQGQRFKYEVVKRYSVKPTEVSIEALSETPKLTLYSCTLKGEADGREVVEATQSATNLSATEVLN